MSDLLNRKFGKTFNTQTLMLLSLGGVLEFYDFTIFLMLAKYISIQFFPGSDYVKIMETYTVMAIGYFARPIGGIILAHFGDIIGRRKIFLLSVLMISIATFIMCVIPSYKAIGLFAPVILLFARLAQGASLGGAVPGAIVFIHEHISKEEKPFGIAVLLIGILAGAFLATLTGCILTSIFTEQEIINYGWRIPFLIGGILGIFVFGMRKDLEETPVFTDMQKKDHICKFPLYILFKNMKKIVFALSLLVFSSEFIISFFIYMLPSFLIAGFHYKEQSAFRLTAVTNGIEVVSFIIFAIILYKRIITIEKYSLFLFFPILGVFFIFLMEFLSNANLLLVFFTLICISFSSGIINIIYKSSIPEFYPPEYRFTGSSVSYNIGIAFAGGLTPLLLTWLGHGGKNLPSIEYSIVVMSFASILAVVSIIGMISTGIVMYLGRREKINYP